MCLYFQVHQPFRFRRYRFFDIGNEHYYYDDYSNESILRKISDKCYLPANAVLSDLIDRFPGKFRLAFSISGTAIDQFEMYAPEVLESFSKLAKTGAVEFLGETDAHSLASLREGDEFSKQVTEHAKKIKKHFGQDPGVFRNTELIYSDEIGARVAKLGYEAMLTEGAKHVLGWKSPNFLYCNAIDPRLKVLLKNFKLSDDIAFRFSDQGWNEYPLTVDKFVSWLDALDRKEEVVNLFMDYETFGEHQWKDTGIFDFLRALPEKVIRDSGFEFATPGEVAVKLQPVSAVQVPYPISWADEERDLTAWLGNEMQQEAFNKLYDLAPKVGRINDPDIRKDWSYLQVSDHLYYMSTKFFSDGAVHSYFNPYASPYDAFINYMNILSDFSIRVNALAEDAATGSAAANLSRIIEEKEKQIEQYREEIDRLSSIVSVRNGEPGSAASPRKAEAGARGKPKTTLKPKSAAKTKSAGSPKTSARPKTGEKAKKEAAPKGNADKGARKKVPGSKKSS